MDKRSMDNISYNNITTLNHYIRQMKETQPLPRWSRQDTTLGGMGRCRPGTQKKE